MCQAQQKRRPSQIKVAVASKRRSFVSIGQQQTIDTIRVMQKQEEYYYNKSIVNYLEDLPNNAVDANCRLVMARWCQEIANICNHQTDTVAVTMNILDRFVSTPAGKSVLLDPSQFQLATLTAFYTAIKINEQEVMSTELVSGTSKGAHSPQDIEAMERKMLNAIKFRVNPPTAMSFVRLLLDLMPDLEFYERERIQMVAKSYIDKIIQDYEFCTVPASSIALACLLNAMESVLGDYYLDTLKKTEIENTMMVEASQIRDLRTTLDKVFIISSSSSHQTRRAKTTPSRDQHATKRSNNIQRSPKSVSSFRATLQSHGPV